jgi:hypothetical protein
MRFRIMWLHHLAILRLPGGYRGQAVVPDALSGANVERSGELEHDLIAPFVARDDYTTADVLETGARYRVAR